MNRCLLVLLLCAACNTTTPSPAPPADGGLQVQIVRLEKVTAEDAARRLEQSMAGQTTNGVAFKVAVKADQNALVLSGSAAQIREALQVVAKLDS
jgi:hypothetical protein